MLPGATERFGEDHDPETHLIPNVLSAATDPQEEVRIFGNQYPTPDGTAIRDYIHVADLADAHIRALEDLRRAGASAALNLGTGHGYSVLEVIESARRVTGIPIRTRIESPRPGDPARLVADPSRAKALLGWQPTMSDLNAIIQAAWLGGKSVPADIAHKRPQSSSYLLASNGIRGGGRISRSNPERGTPLPQ
jgi:UDP-glucose 4-epimerase